MTGHYKIGEFARNLGLSTGFLKHHEKDGLLSPKTSPSGYRYYEFSQAMQAVQCLGFQNLGFTGKEIAELMNNSANCNLTEMVLAKHDVLQKQLLFLDELLKDIERNTRLFPEAAAHENNFSWDILAPAPFLFLENALEGAFLPADAFYEIVRDWNQYFPITRVASRIRLEPSIESLSDSKPEDAFKVSRWSQGLMMPLQSAQRLSASMESPVETITPGKCLIVHFSGKRRRQQKRNFVKQILEEPLRICQEHNFCVQGDIFQITIFDSNAAEEKHVREEILIPLEAK